MIRWNVSKSNEAIDREQAISKLRKLTRYCKWGTICTIVALALALLAVIAIELLFILPSLSQGFCLQSVELTAGEGPFLALAIALSAYRFFSAIEKAGRPFNLECIRILRQIGHLFLIGGAAVKLFGAIVTGLILSGFGGSFTDALGGQHLDLSMLFAGLIFSLIASIFRYGYILQKQDDELL